jgi:trans-aconitate 2-methyltransferase
LALLDTWDPKQYENFIHLRQPAITELLSLIEPAPGMRILDMGAGSGDFSCLLWDHLQPASFLGVEMSENMLAQARQKQRPGMSFVLGDINTFTTAEKFDLIFCNGVLHYAADRKRALRDFRSMLTERGQIAVQLPDSFDTFPIALGFNLAGSDRYRDHCQKSRVVGNRIGIETYAQHLHEMGFTEQVVRVQAHAHPLSQGIELYRWLEQTFLQRFAGEMPPDLFAEFKAEYAELLSEAIPFDQPHLYVLKRLYLWGQIG